MVEEKRPGLSPGGVSRREFIGDAGLAAAAWVAGRGLITGGNYLAAEGGDAALPAPEWTYEQAAKIWKPMTRAVQHVGVPGCQWQTGVMWDGALLFGPLDFRYLSVMQDELKLLGSRGEHRKGIKTLWVIASTSQWRTGVRCTSRTGWAQANPPFGAGWKMGGCLFPAWRLPMATSSGRRAFLLDLLNRDFAEGMDSQPDDLPITHAIFKVRNRGSQPQVGHLWLHFADTTQVTLGYKCAQGDELGNALDHTFATPLGMMKDLVRYVIPPPSQGQVTWHEEGPTPEGMKQPAKRVIEWEVPLKSGEEAQLRVLIPYGPVEREMGLEILEAE